MSDWKNVQYKDGKFRSNGSGGGSSTLAGLNDVDISNPSDGQVLKYNDTTDKWENANESGGSSSANNVSYDNTTSGMTATNVQDALDEIAQDFRDGCDTISQAVIAKGQTPASNSPQDIAYAISQISGGSGANFETKTCFSPNGGYIHHTRYFQPQSTSGTYILKPHSNGIGSDGYLYAPLGTATQKFRMSIRFYISATSSSQIIIGSSSNSYAQLPSMEVMSGNQVGVGMSYSNSGSWQSWTTFDTRLVNGNFYRWSIEWDGTKVLLKLYDADDNVLETKTINWTNKPIVYNSSQTYYLCGFGSGSHPAYNIYVDLWNTYIKVEDSITWGTDERGMES